MERTNDGEDEEASEVCAEEEAEALSDWEDCCWSIELEEDLGC